MIRRLVDLAPANSGRSLLGTLLDDLIELSDELIDPVRHLRSLRSGLDEARRCVPVSIAEDHLIGTKGVLP